MPLPFLPQPEILTVLSPWHPLTCPLALEDAQMAKEPATLGLAVAAHQHPRHTESRPQRRHVLCVRHVDDQRPQNHQ